MTVYYIIYRLLLFQSPVTLNTLFFYPMRLPSLDSGRLFSAKIAFRDQPFFFDYIRAILRNLFRRPCANFSVRAGLRSVAPRKGLLAL